MSYGPWATPAEVVVSPGNDERHVHELILSTSLSYVMKQPATPFQMHTFRPVYWVPQAAVSLECGCWEQHANCTQESGGDGLPSTQVPAVPSDNDGLLERASMNRSQLQTSLVKGIRHARVGEIHETWSKRFLRWLSSTCT